MSLILTDNAPMAQERDRVDLRADPELIARIRRQAKRSGVGSVSAYIRQAVVRQLESDERSEADAPKLPRKQTKPPAADAAGS